MRCSLQLPTDRPGAEFQSAAAIAEMAAAAEAAGFDACSVTEHPFPDWKWLQAGGHHTLDPFVALSIAAAATERIRLQTHVLVLAYRNPFLTAKAVASLDVASGGRVVLGVAAGYLEGEFRALGVDPAERNELTDEAIVAMRAAWSGDRIELRGRHYHAASNAMEPRPAQRPHPPIWVGGNSRRAIRRAVELGDGWLPIPAPPPMARHIGTSPLATLADLEDGLRYAREHAERIGRTEPLEICFVPFGGQMGATRFPEAAPWLEDAAALAARGVTWINLGLPHENRRQWLDAVARFGDEILIPLRRQTPLRPVERGKGPPPSV